MLTLDACHLLSGLPDEEVAAVQQRGQRRRYPARALIIQEGETGNVVFFVLEGRLRVFAADDDGGEIVLNVLEPGSCCGELALLGDGVRSASVMTLEPAVLFSLSGSELRAVFERHPAVFNRLLSLLGQRVKALSDNVRSLALDDVYVRVTRYLHEAAEVTSDGLLVAQDLTQRELASRVGASREMVARILRELRVGGYISTSRGRILIRKPLPKRF